MNIMYVRLSDDALRFILLAVAKIRFKSKTKSQITNRQLLILFEKPYYRLPIFQWRKTFIIEH
jgi:hypothetical protein